MRRVALIATVGVLCLASSAAPAQLSGLRGKVTLSPASPVCIEEQACSRPARNVLLAFRRDERVVARATTTDEAAYRVVLAPGRYSVSAPRFRRGSGVTPSRLRVVRGRFARIDLDIDTGIQ